MGPAERMLEVSGLEAESLALEVGENVVRSTSRSLSLSLRAIRPGPHVTAASNSRLQQPRSVAIPST